MAGHTPGPWTAAPMVRHADNAFYITATPNGNNSEKEVAVVGPCLAKTTAANARLIAAAPDLLDALEALAKLTFESGLTADNTDDWRQARVAIAKARGEA